MSIVKKKTTEKDVSVEINLEKLLGGQAKNRDIREAFFQVAYDKWLENLDNGIGADGKRLAKYSKSYKDSLAFLAFGKDNTVNMQLTGGMVASVEIQKQSDKSIKVGFVGDEENAKAYAHMTGFQGHPTLEGKVPIRNFFGWSDDDLLKIAKEFKPNNKSEPNVKDEKILNLIDRLINNG